MNNVDYKTNVCFHPNKDKLYIMSSMKHISLELKLLIEHQNKIFPNVPVKDWEYKYNLNTWSKKEILGHLVDSRQHHHKHLICGQTMQCGYGGSYIQFLASSILKAKELTTNMKNSLVLYDNNH